MKKIIYNLLYKIKQFINRKNPIKRQEMIISIYFGLPGSGKTTMAAAIAKKFKKRGVDVYSNVPILTTKKLNPINDLGNYHIEDCKIIIDEAGLEYNNREYKTFNKANHEFFKLHRHYKTSIDVFSQTWNDMDKKIRILAQKLYIVKKSIIPYFIVAKPIYKKIGINDMTKEICDEYYFLPFFMFFKNKYCFMPTTWKMFDTYDAPKLKIKSFVNW